METLVIWDAISPIIASLQCSVWALVHAVSEEFFTYMLSQQWDNGVFEQNSCYVPPELFFSNME